jgi:hypothetical protein
MTDKVEAYKAYKVDDTLKNGLRRSENNLNKDKKKITKVILVLSLISMFSTFVLKKKH